MIPLTSAYKIFKSNALYVYAYDKHTIQVYCCCRNCGLRCLLTWTWFLLARQALCFIILIECQQQNTDRMKTIILWSKSTTSFRGQTCDRPRFAHYTTVKEALLCCAHFIMNVKAFSFLKRNFHIKGFVCTQKSIFEFKAEILAHRFFMLLLDGIYRRNFPTIS